MTTSSEPATVGKFGERFAVECLEEGGVLVDLESGSYFALNRTAATICAVLSEDLSIDETAGRLGERLGLSRSAALGAIDDVLREASRLAKGDEPIGPFSYRKEGKRYVLKEANRIILEVDAERNELSLSARPPFRFPMIEYVRAVTPKLLALTGVTVLHAAACTLGERAIAFSGVSGAGKTTTVRAFVTGGAAPKSEDLVVMTEEESPSFYLQGETVAHEWARQTAAVFQAANERAVSFDSLRSAASGPQHRLDEVWFLDAERRRNETFERRPLRPLAGLLSLLRHAFCGVGTPEQWRRHVSRVRELSGGLISHEVIAPAGLEALDQAARSYVANFASY